MTCLSYPNFFSSNFKKALNDVILSRRAIQNMNTLYPDATAEELQLSDNICIICREDMVSNSKKLPCGHIFHTICLRSWFQRQQTCPTCRLNILRTPVTAQSQPVNAAGAPAAGAPVAANGVQGAAAAAGQQQGAAPVAPGATPTANATGQPPVPGQASMTAGMPIPPIPTMFPMMMPGMPPPPPMPFMIPPPPVPPGLDRLTDEELHLLHGTERRHVEERIKFLRNVQTLIDASVALMSQYQAISLQYPIPEPVAVTAPAVPPPTAVIEAEKQQESEPVASSSKQAVPTTEREEKLEDKVTIRDVIEDEDSQDAARNTPSPTSASAPSSPNDEFAEVRRRRLERFSNPAPPTTSD